MIVLNVFTLNWRNAGVIETVSPGKAATIRSKLSGSHATHFLEPEQESEVELTVDKLWGKG